MNESDLIEIVQLKQRNPKGFVRTIYKKPNGDFVKKCEFKGEVKWIEMRHGAEFYDEERDWTFQEVFHVSEAIEHGYEVPCNFDKYIEPYKNLTCDPSTLILLKEISAKGLGGDYQLSELHECPKCHQIWQIDKQMDSQRGMNIQCHKVADRGSIA